MAGLVKWIAFNGKLRQSTDEEEQEKYKISRLNPVVAPINARVFIAEDNQVILDTMDARYQVLQNDDIKKLMN